jgi:hypothetical protein
MSEKTIIVFGHWNNGNTLSRITSTFVQNFINSSECNRVVVVGPPKIKWVEDSFTHERLRYHASDEFEDSLENSLKPLEPIDKAVFQIALCAGSYENVSDVYVFGDFERTIEVAARISLLEKDNFNTPVNLRIYDNIIEVHDMKQSYIDILQNNFKSVMFLQKDNPTQRFNFGNISPDINPSIDMDNIKYENTTQARDNLLELIGYDLPKNSVIILVINDDLHTCNEILHAYTNAIQEEPRLVENDRTLLFFVHSSVDRTFAEYIQEQPTNVQNNVIYFFRPLPTNVIHTLMKSSNIGCHFDRFVTKEHEHFDRFLWGNNIPSCEVTFENKTYSVPDSNALKNLFLQLRF